MKVKRWLMVVGWGTGEEKGSYLAKLCLNQKCQRVAELNKCIVHFMGL